MRQCFLALSIFASSAMLICSTYSLAAEMPLGLREAIVEALQNNLNLQLDKERLNEATGAAVSAEGSFDTLLNAAAGTGKKQITPLVTAGADEEAASNWSIGLSKTFTPGTRFSLSWDNNQLDTEPQVYLFDPVYSSALNLKITQPLLQGLGSQNQTALLRAAEKQRDARALVVESTSADLAAEVINAYWDLVFSWQDIEVKKVSLELAKKLFEETEERINAGKLADVELFRPQSEVALREERLIFAERNIGLAEDRIKVLLNSDEWNSVIKPTDLPSKEIQKFAMDEILENTLKNKPDLKAALLNSEAAEIILKSARDKTRSSLDLFGAVGLSGTDDSYGDTLDNLSGDADTSWQLGLSFSRPLDNSFARGEVIQAEAVYDRAIISTRILKQEIRRTVRATLRDVNLAVKNMEATRKTSLASLKGLEAEQIKFDAGRGTTLDVLVSQERYASALSQQKLAVINYAKTLAELDRIQGIVSLPED